VRTYTATVHDNSDPDRAGRLQLVIPQLFDDQQAYPEWIDGVFLAGPPSSVGLFWIPPVGAIVSVFDYGGGSLRWSAGELGGVQRLADVFAAASSYPNRAGFTSPAGDRVVLLDDSAKVAALLAGAGGTVELRRTLEGSTERVILGDSLIGELRAPVDDLTAFVAAVAAAASSSPAVPVTNATLAGFLGTLVTSLPIFAGKLAASETAGAPFLSSVSRSE
jgi:hypothetical protein